MYTPSPMIDDELAILQYLKGITAITTLVPAARITTELAPSPTYPVILVQRGGGEHPVWQRLDEPVLQVDVIGTAGTKSAVKAITQLVRACILAISNDVVAAGTLVSASQEVGPQWFPDEIPNPPLPRYTMRFAVITHP